MEEYYKILGVHPSASDEEIESAYQSLRAEYSRDRFLEGDAGNIAAKKLSKLEEAYNEIFESRKAYAEKESAFKKDEQALISASNAIKQGDLLKAQQQLDSISNKNAEWHYLQSVIFYKRNWINESRNQLEIALSKDPNNTKYRTALNKLNEKANFNANNYQGGYQGGYNNYQQNNYNRQMGGDGCMDCCTAYCCTQILMDICCGCR